MRCTNCKLEGVTQRHPFPLKTEDLCIYCQDAIQQALKKRREPRQPLIFKEEEC